MATKSIVKSVNIKSKGAAQALVRAMEKAYTKSGQTVKMSRPAFKVSESEIEKMFDKSKQEAI